MPAHNVAGQNDVIVAAAREKEPTRCNSRDSEEIQSDGSVALEAWEFGV